MLTSHAPRTPASLPSPRRPPRLPSLSSCRYLDRLLDAEGSADKLTSQLAAEKLRCAEAERLAASLREDAAAHESAHERTREQLDSTLQSNSEQARRLESLEARNDMLDFEDSGVGHSGGDTLSSEFGGGESLSGLAGGGDALQTCVQRAPLRLACLPSGVLVCSSLFLN